MNTRVKLITGFICCCILPVIAAAWIMLNRVEAHYFESLQSGQRLVSATLALIAETSQDSAEETALALKEAAEKLNRSPHSGGMLYLLGNDGTLLTDSASGIEDIRPIIDGMVSSGQQSLYHSIGFIGREALKEGGFQVIQVVPVVAVSKELARIRWQVGLLLSITLLAIGGGAALVYGYFTTHSAKARAFIHRLDQPGLPLPTMAPGGECEDICTALLNQAELLRQCETRLNEVNITDPLTGVYNRQTILSKLEEEIAKTNRYNTPLTAIALTVDRYQSIFERFGYETADEVLCRLTALLQASLRSHDVIGRLEANLFLIILPLTQVENGKLICDRIRDAVEVSYWGNPELQLTISGAAVIPEDVESVLQGFEELIQLAKGQGGNRIVMKN